ncbi:filamin-A-interacting protein 1 [Striga asiatica]|uniref:Filamin-A-interacting protein 1 n=1 Tax=Striga asiatica TaxID=4170 RepID=A0A5A7PT35_STRAF|nr:filamin-A-interacting protein 1 [Striga asiatica]
MSALRQCVSRPHSGHRSFVVQPPSACTCISSAARYSPLPSSLTTSLSLPSHYRSSPDHPKHTSTSVVTPPDHHEHHSPFAVTWPRPRSQPVAAISRTSPTTPTRPPSSAPIANCRSSSPITVVSGG